MLLSAACFGPIPSAARELAVVSELVHSATLLHDDVIDDSPERRGTEAARKVWGNAVSVLAGDLLLTHALDRTFAAAPAALSDLLTTLRRLVDGEIIQLRGRARARHHAKRSISAFSKTRRPRFSAGRRAPAPSSRGPAMPSKQALGYFGERLGVAFQLVDDALDYAGDASATGKALFADFGEREGHPAVGPGPHRRARAFRVGRTSSKRRPDGRTGSRASGARDGRLRRSEAARRAETDRALAALSELRPSPAREMLRVVATELTMRAR